MPIKALAIFLSLVFLASGGAKLAGLAFETVAFEKWGYPLWFMYLTGVIELAGGVGLLVGRLSALAGACLALMMIGAVSTHVVHAEWGVLFVAAALLLLLAAHAWGGRADILALARRRF